MDILLSENFYYIVIIVLFHGLSVSWCLHGGTICETPEEIHGLENKSIALLNLFAFFSFKPLFGPILL